MKFIYTLVALLFSTTFMAGGDSTKVVLISHWQKGDVLNYEIVKIRDQWKGEVLDISDSVSYLGQFEVLEATADGFRLKWSYTHELFNNYNIPPNIFNKLKTPVALEVYYTTDKHGAFESIENWQEVGQKITKEVYNMVDLVTGDTATARDELKATMRPIIQIISSRHGVQEMVLKELQYFHYPYGAAFRLGDTLSYSQEIPNLLGGDPIRARTDVYMSEQNVATKECSIVNEMSLDEEDTKRVVIEFLRSRDFDENEITDLVETSDMYITDRNTMRYDYGLGIPQHIDAHRTTLVNVASLQSKRVDRTIIKLVK